MSDVQIEVQDGVGTVTLNRPQVKNAMPGTGWAALHDAFTDLGYRDDVRVVVVTGTGGDFCSGADVSAFGSRSEEPVHSLDSMRRVGDAVMALFHCPKPTIAKVSGVAAGAGANLCFGADLVVADDTARFCEIFSRRGLSIDFGGSFLLPRRIGLHKAKEMVLLAKMVHAEEAADMGLVNKVVPAAELDDAVTEWVDILKAGPPRALAMSKDMLNRSMENSMDEAVRHEGWAQTVNFAQGDVKEAAVAWSEKRDAKFTGW